MAISRVDFGGRTLMDLTNDSVTSASLLAGYTAHGADGELIRGAAAPASSGVESFNGRTGSVMPIAGDYADNQVYLSSTMHIGGEDQTTVQQALNALVKNSESIAIDNLETGKSSRLKRIILSSSNPSYSHDFEDGDVWFKYGDSEEGAVIYENVLMRKSANKVTLYFSLATRDNFAAALKDIFTKYTIKQKTAAFIGFRAPNTSGYYFGDVVVDNSTLTLYYTTSMSSSAYKYYELTKSNGTVTVSTAMSTNVNKYAIGQMDFLI